jgi:hypothetical protein
MPDEDAGERRQSAQRRESEDRIGKQFREDIQALRTEIRTGFADQRLFIAEEIPRQFEVLGISTRTEDVRKEWRENFSFLAALRKKKEITIEEVLKKTVGLAFLGAGSVVTFWLLMHGWKP